MAAKKKTPAAAGATLYPVLPIIKPTDLTGQQNGLPDRQHSADDSEAVRATRKARRDRMELSATSRIL
jgi:hypothetical protein